ncbi:2-C-methyl-D-erythritol 4-phosphate cytidylyltransferase [Rhodopirellula maiorica SM1]|uniref:2-C-methyl-D-erythritol 4-phosphate cytidylyltransferase n=1 Tax=Rhodopirellula maiorica SM1 TaxID=1265738 RepID=M5RQY7_9BACT|nr:2-C-methyl-D-erythritol 4-phosphate cytidylyltransferase [Rhodopirellula maiorica]EMI16364.1 2-C-methyl-D-erythritol 4-phosphate cytidylyltransferase [Rhodopirellula maiorica SM1]
MNDPHQTKLTTGCIAAVLPAAGSGQRFGSDRNKLFAMLGGKPIWFHAASRLAARPEVGRIMMAISEGDEADFRGPFAELVNELGIELVRGGDQRSDSVRAGLDAIANDKSIEFIAIHDAARPLVCDADLAAVFAKVAETGAAILAAPVTATLKRQLDDGNASLTVDRSELYTALTPQVFRVDVLRCGYDRHRGRPATDDAQLVERTGYRVALVHGSADNIKITHPEDLRIAEAILAR